MADAVTAEQPRIVMPPQAPMSPDAGAGMIIGPPSRHEVSVGVPPIETPAGLAAGTSAAHEAAAHAAEAEVRRTGGSVTPTRGPTAAIRPPIAPEVSSPIEPRTAVGSDFLSARAGATRGILPPTDSIIEGTVAGEGSPLPLNTKKMYRRRRRATMLVFLALAIVVLVVGQWMGRDDDRSSTVITTPVASALEGQQPDVGVGEPTVADDVKTTKHDAGAATGAAAGQVPADTADTAPAEADASTAGAFSFVGGYGSVLGSAGTLRRFKVAVENTIGQGDGGDFADEVDRILGDPRSWIAGRQFRLQRVPQSAASEFTVYLASAKTSEKMCGEGGLKTDGYTSCRLPGQVIINMDRWQDAVPDYDAPLATYRAYAINHEVGHQLGYGHEPCPGKGRPAPVMMQQTYGLMGCIANSWPYVDGKRYSDSPIA
jgi:hypothetical protein